jgi:hypothetical protein
MRLAKYSMLHMEAVACLWEAMLEERQFSTLHKAFADLGTVTMRHHAIYLSDMMLKVWDCMSEDEREECIPYDWEFAPRFLEVIQWGSNGPEYPSDPREFAELILVQGVTAP